MNTKFVLIGSILIALAFAIGPIMATVTYTPPTIDGDFYINDILAVEDTVIKVSDPDLDIKFILTVGDENNVKAVWVERWEDGVWKSPDQGLSHTSVNTWTHGYTLPYVGTFELRGYILDKAIGSPEIRLMSVSGEWTGDEGTLEGEPTDGELPFDPVAVALGIMGFACLAVGVIVPSKKKWS